MSKLNAFLAAVPANGAPSPVLKGKAAPVVAFPELQMVDTTSPLELLGRRDLQPSTPQPPQRRARRSKQRDSRAMSNQDEAPVPAAVTPMKPKTQAGRKSSSGEQGEANGSEAGPMRRLSAQGSHHRRVSTDTTMFSRNLRQYAHREVTAETVEHFGAVPVITTATRATGGKAAGNNNEEEVGVEVDPAELMERLRRGETIGVANALEIVKRTTNLLALEQNVIHIKAPYTLVGDLHGQFHDLLEIFRVHGLPSPTNPFLFLGDYVDRGVASCEIILLLFAFKAAHPESVHLLRGNHECRSLSTFYGFRAECLRKYGLVVYNRVVKCFESMPLAAQVETAVGTFLAVHGGLSPDLLRVEDINTQVNRFMEPEPTGALCDLLWSDPAKRDDDKEADWVPNAVRGCSYTFNEHACRTFLERNNLLAIIRAHELEEEGFREHFRHGTPPSSPSSDDDTFVRQLPPVITVFSAPEYCNTNHNMGATLQLAWQRGGPAGGELLEYCQHKRSSTRESEFAGASEHTAMQAFLRDHAAFFPADFYDLVRLCRQLKVELEQRASRSVSLVSAMGTDSVKTSLGRNLDDIDDHGRSDRRSSTTQGEEFEVKIGSSDKADGATRSPTVAYAPGPATPAPAPTKSKMRTARAATSREGSSPSAKSSWKFCPGVVRFYERCFGPKRASKSSPSPGRKLSWFSSCGQLPTGSDDQTEDNNAEDQVSPAVIAAPPATVPARRKSAHEWMTMPSGSSLTQVAAHHGSAPVDESASVHINPANLFTTQQWQALKLLFVLLDVNGDGVLMEESFVVLLAEQDSDAYATEEELSLLLEVMDFDGDGLVTERDFLRFAHRARQRWERQERV